MSQSLNSPIDLRALAGELVATLALGGGIGAAIARGIYDRKNNKETNKTTLATAAASLDLEHEKMRTLSQTDLVNLAGILLQSSEEQVAALRSDIADLRTDLSTARMAHENCEKDREVQRRRIDSLEAMQIGGIVAVQQFAEGVTKPSDGMGEK